MPHAHGRPSRSPGDACGAPCVVRAATLLALLALLALSLPACKATKAAVKGDHRLTLRVESAEDTRSVFLVLAPEDALPDPGDQGALERAVTDARERQAYRYFGQFQVLPGTPPSWQPVGDTARPGLMRVRARPGARELELRIARRFLLDHDEVGALLVALARDRWVAVPLSAKHLADAGSSLVELSRGELRRR